MYGFPAISTLNYALSHYLAISICLFVYSEKVIAAEDEPYFVEGLNNVTIPKGRDASFQCIVHNLKGFQVAWFQRDKHTLLALGDKVIFRSGRITVSSHAGTTFYLHLHDIREEDRGAYMCQINTSPMKSQTGYLQVFVPPRISETLTSGDTEVREDSSVSLTCSASGTPTPEIKWRREDGQTIHVGSNQNNKVTTISGESLNMTKVTRLHMGAYICIASNGIQPAVSKRIVLGVNFSPLVWTPNQQLGAPIGSDVLLECNLESHPHSVTYWTKSAGQAIIVSNSKYESILFEGTSSSYKSEMRLRIKDLKPSDFGTYSCVAKNEMGQAQGTIKLYETPRPSTLANTNSAPDLYSFTTIRDNNARRKYYIGTRSSIGFEDNQSERGFNKAIVLTDAFGYEITSEHITIQSEERTTLNNYNQDSGAKNSASLWFTSIFTLAILLSKL